MRMGPGILGPSIVFGLGIVIAWHGLMFPAVGQRVSSELSTAARLLDQGHYSDAFIHFRRALSMDGTNRRARVGLRKLTLMSEVRSMKPAVLTRLVIQQFPGYQSDPNLLLLLARAALADGRLEQGARLIGRALRLSKDYAEAWYYLGQIRWEQSRPEQAIQAVERAARLEPDHRGYMMWLLVKFFERSDMARAGAMAKRLIARLSSLEPYIESYTALIETDRLDISLFMQRILVDSLKAHPGLAGKDRGWCISGATGKVCMTDEQQKTAFVYKHYLLSVYIAGGVPSARSNSESASKSYLGLRQTIGKLDYDQDLMAKLLRDLTRAYIAARPDQSGEIRAALQRVLEPVDREGAGPNGASIAKPMAASR